VDSLPLTPSTCLGDPATRAGRYALGQAEGFNILCIPPDLIDGDTLRVVYRTAATHCVVHRAMLIIDPPNVWQDAYARRAINGIAPAASDAFSLDAARSSAVYFPRVPAPDPLRSGQVRTFPNSGYLAGIWARADLSTGVWKAPAGLSAGLNDVIALADPLDDATNGALNAQGINCLRNFPIGGIVAWVRVPSVAPIRLTPMSNSNPPADPVPGNLSAAKHRMGGVRVER